MSNTNAAVVPTVSPGQHLDVSLVDQNLSLANGMTAGYGIADNHFDNQPFNQRTYGQWPAQPIRVGLLRNIPGSLPPQPGGSQAGFSYTLYFMFNPNQITSSFAANLSQGAPLYLYGAGSSGSGLSQSSAEQISSLGSTSSSSTVPNLANSQSISFSLFFDRTYDMLYGATDGANPSFDRGVLKDVAALYNLMGTFLTDAAVPVSTPCEVVFGQNGAGQLWGFTGYISSVQITYGIFRHDMIPSRCEVDLTMTTTYTAQQLPGTTAAAGAAAAVVGGLPSTVNTSNNIVTQDGLTFLSGATVTPPVKVSGPPINISEPPNKIINQVLNQKLTVP